MKRISKHDGHLHNTTTSIKDAYYPEVSVDTSTHGSYSLEGRLLAKDPNETPNILVIHGARADFTKADALFLPLHERGLTLLSATVSGHGVAGHHSELPFTLNDNLTEATAFAELLTSQKRIVIGFSMGGTTAVRLVGQSPELYDKLILFYPAVFTDLAYNIPFGTEAFRNIASQKDSFLSSSFFDIIHTFPGKILLIKGEFDGLDPKEYGKTGTNTVGTTTINGRDIYSPIPPEVFSRILEVRPDTEYVILPGADHQFAKWFVDHPDDASIVVKKVFDFINS